MSLEREDAILTWDTCKHWNTRLISSAMTPCGSHFTFPSKLNKIEALLIGIGLSTAFPA